MPDYGVRKAREVVDTHRESIAKAYRAGVKIALGTDAAVVPHGTNLRELGLMCDAGMQPMDVLVASTRTAAECLGWHDRVGTVEAGKLADIVVIPSLVSEPFGNIAVEAALAARPLVVSRLSGLLEITDGQPGVHRVPPGDVAAIADAVRDIIAHWPEQRAQAQAAARLVSTRFDPERYRLAIVDLIASLVQRSTPNRNGHRPAGAARA